MYGIVYAKNWEDVCLLGRKLIRWAFRGQQSAEWTLQTSIEKTSRDFGHGFEMLDNREFWILRQFQRRGYLLIDRPPAEDSRLDWLALIQHYGGPTRLLDFTHSFYVASFFAMEDSIANSALWCIDMGKIEQANGEMFDNETIDHLNRRYIGRVEKILSGDIKEKGVINIEPDRFNERMSIQQGLFLFAKDITLPFMTNLAITLQLDPDKLNDGCAAELIIRKDLNVYEQGFPSIIKIVLPKGMHEESLGDLDRMNINAKTLFPGMDGFARSLKQHLRV